MPQDEQLLPPDFFLGLDRSGPVPLYYQVSNLLEEAIHDETIAFASGFAPPNIARFSPTVQPFERGV